MKHESTLQRSDICISVRILGVLQSQLNSASLLYSSFDVQRNKKFNITRIADVEFTL